MPKLLIPPAVELLQVPDHLKGLSEEELNIDRVKIDDVFWTVNPRGALVSLIFKNVDYVHRNWDLIFKNFTDELVVINIYGRLSVYYGDFDVTWRSNI